MFHSPFKTEREGSGHFLECPLINITKNKLKLLVTLQWKCTSGGTQLGEQQCTEDKLSLVESVKTGGAGRRLFVKHTALNHGDSPMGLTSFVLLP